jgi:hypothetical protein
LFALFMGLETCRACSNLLSCCLDNKIPKMSRTVNSNEKTNETAPPTVPTNTHESRSINADTKLGSVLEQFGREAGGVDLDITRDPTPAEPASFE